MVACPTLSKKGEEKMTKKALFTRKKTTAMAVLLATAVIFAVMGTLFESTLPGTWGSQCKIEKSLDPLEVIQVGDAMYLTKEADFTIYVSRSFDGCSWSEVELSIFEGDHPVWRHSERLFKAPGDKLGMGWVESYPEKESANAFYWSTFDGSTWSEPERLLLRDGGCFLKDVIALEDGALLLLWKENLIQYGEKTYSGSGCHIIYTGYVDGDEKVIEDLNEPENPMVCSAEGYSLIQNGDRIWCIFRSEETTYAAYGSWSGDNKHWNDPEPVEIPGGPNESFFLTDHGEIGITKSDEEGKNLFLFTSPDWVNWSREKLFTTEQSMIYAEITQGKDGRMWGIVETDDEIFFIEPSQILSEDYEKNMFFINILITLSLSCIVLLLILVLLWIWKYKRT